MNTTKFHINCKFLTLSLIGLCLLFIPGLVYAGTFFHCTDKSGNETLLDFPIEGQTCKQIQTHEEITSTRGVNKTYISDDDKITKVIVKGNHVLVPATVVYGKNEVDVHLVLDTGASATMIHTNVAEELYINLSKARKVKTQVVGGAVIESNIVRMNILKIGPHTIYNKDIVIVPFEGLC
ncbi:MAG: retropepsin-like aspartic protease [Smithella sp.]